MATKPPKPSIADLQWSAVCPECGGKVERKSNRGPAPVYCCREHKVAHQNRRVVRGAPLVGLAMAWRINRGSGDVAKAAFAQLCQALDQYCAEDAAAGRPRADLYVAKLISDGSMFFDRQR